MDDMDDDTPLRLGWEEWVALPGLDLPALRAKVDTGARTSALHADGIEPYGPAAAPRVRFTVHPIPGDALAIRCTAPLKDRREVTSSNGEAELRYVIETEIAVDGRRWPIEVTLTDRGAMAYRMLLGRQAIPPDAVVAPNEAFCQPQLSNSLYDDRRRSPRAGQTRALRIALLGGAGEGPTLRRLTAEAEARGHVVIDVDAARCAMVLDGLAPELWMAGVRLDRPDAVVARIGAAHAAHGLAVLRQFATMGALCVNPPGAIQVARDRVAAHQALARARVALPPSGFAASGGAAAALADLLSGLPGDAGGPLWLHLSGAPAPVAVPDAAAARGVIAAMRDLRATVLVQRRPEAPGVRVLVMAGRVVAQHPHPQPAARSGGTPGRALRPAGRSGKAPGLTKPERTLALRAARALDLSLATVDLLRAAGGTVVGGVDPAPPLDAVARATGADPYAALLDMIERRVGRAASERG